MIEPVRVLGCSNTYCATESLMIEPVRVLGCSNPYYVTEPNQGGCFAWVFKHSPCGYSLTHLAPSASYSYKSGYGQSTPPFSLTYCSPLLPPSSPYLHHSPHSPPISTTPPHPLPISTIPPYPPPPHPPTPPISTPPPPPPPHSLIIKYVNGDEPSWKGYFYASLMFVAASVQSLSYHQHWDVVFRIGMRIRSSIIAAVYSKVCLFVCLFVSVRGGGGGSFTLSTTSRWLLVLQDQVTL